ncbi:hypothetical protein I7I48_07430 [Histoplasma ohiense]|nr:hypothetical protein I7I48_07430 [Histoplasma ohiense (nom. inval.)]
MPRHGPNSTILGLYMVKSLKTSPPTGPWMSHHVVNRQNACLRTTVPQWSASELGMVSGQLAFPSAVSSISNSAVETPRPACVM